MPRKKSQDQASDISDRRGRVPLPAAFCRSSERRGGHIFVLAWRVGAYRIEPILSAGAPTSDPGWGLPTLERRRVPTGLNTGLEGIVSKRLGAPYRSGPSRNWLKVKNPDSPAMVRARGAVASRDRRQLPMITI
jgi:hypothetical protein